MLSIKIGSSPIEIEMLLVKFGGVSRTNRDVELNRDQTDQHWLIGMQHHGRWGVTWVTSV